MHEARIENGALNVYHLGAQDEAMESTASNQSNAKDARTTQSSAVARDRAAFQLRQTNLRDCYQSQELLAAKLTANQQANGANYAYGIITINKKTESLRSISMFARCPVSDGKSSCSATGAGTANSVRRIYNEEANLLRTWFPALAQRKPNVA